MINMDHGILPAATEEMRRDFGVTNSKLGFMGSIVYLGLVTGNKWHHHNHILGALVAIPVFHYMQAKIILVFCLILNSASLYLIILSGNYYIFLLSRFAVGFF